MAQQSGQTTRGSRHYCSKGSPVAHNSGTHIAAHELDASAPRKPDVPLAVSLQRSVYVEHPIHEVQDAMDCIALLAVPELRKLNYHVHAPSC